MSQPRALGIIAPQLSGVYFAELLRGIQAVIIHQYPHLICFQGSPEELLKTHLATSQVAGWVIINTAQGIEQLALSGRPTVAIGVQVQEGLCPVVSPDNHIGMQAAVAHLLLIGHRQIAFVGNMTHSDIAQRYAGYLAAYEVQGLPAPTGIQVATPNGMVATRELIERLKHEMGCTAIVGATDETALVLISAIQELGLNIPTDLAVVGFDDIILAQASSPPLTTVRYSIEALGRTAAELLLAKLAGETFTHHTYYVPTSLILRQSCGGRTTHNLRTMHGDSVIEADWQIRLHAELLEQLYSPALPPDPQIAWPDSSILVQGLAASVAGKAPILASSLTQAWRSAVTICGDYVTLSTNWAAL